MDLILRNGEKITLDWNLIVLEYLEEYEGGIEQLREDIADKNKRFHTFNFVIYCIVSATYSEELSYEEIISLVNINDYEKLIDFITKNINRIKNTNNEKEKNSNTRKKFKKHTKRYYRR